MKRVAFVLGVAALAAACGGRQAQPTAVATQQAIEAQAPTDRDPARRCIRKVKVVGAAWAAEYAPKQKDGAHNWGKTLSCPRGGAAIGPW